MTTTSPGFDLLFLHGFKRSFFGIEHARRAGMENPLVAREFHDATLGSERAAQNREAAVLLDGICERTNHFLPGSFLGALNLLEESSSGGGRPVVQQTCFLKALAQQPHAAGVKHVRRGEAAARFQIRQYGSFRRNLVELVELQGHASVASDSQQVQHGVCRTAGGGYRSNRVFERRVRNNLARAKVPTKKFHHGLAAINGDLQFARINGGNFICSHGRNPEKRNRGRHRIGRELTAARARSGTRAIFELRHLLRGHLASRECAGRLEHVLNRDIVTLKSSGHDRAAVKHQAGNVQSCERHHRGGNCLVAAADRDHGVKRVRAHKKLDGISDHLARNQRSFHALGAHGDSVGYHDGVALDGRAARGADAFLYLFRERAQVEIAGCDVAPRVGHGDERPRQIGVRQACRFQHGAGRRPCDTFFNCVALHFELAFRASLKQKAPRPVSRCGAHSPKRGLDGRPPPYDYIYGIADWSSHRVASHSTMDNRFPLVRAAERFFTAGETSAAQPSKPDSAR